MLPVGLWRVSNKARQDFLERIDLEEEESPQEMSNVSSISKAEMLVVEPVQNAAGDEWGDAKIALEHAQMMVDLGVDLLVEDFSCKLENKELRMGRHGVVDTEYVQLI